MGDMRSWRKAIDEMFSDEIDPRAANRPPDGEYELCPVCSGEDADCEYCDGVGLIDRTGEHRIPDFSKMQMEGSVTERNEAAKIKMKPEDLTDPDDDGMVERPESSKNVDNNLKAVAKRYGVEFVDDFKEYSKKNVKESDAPYATMDDGPDDYLYNKNKKQKLVGEADSASPQRLEVGNVVEFESKGKIYYGVIKQVGDRFVRVQLSHYPEAPPIRINRKRVSKIKTNMSESTMDKDMQEMLRLAGMYVTPTVYEQNESGDESPLTNTKDSIDRLGKEIQKDKDKKKDNKFKNEDGDLSVLSESDEQEWIDAVNTALEYIDAEHEVAYDVASANGQMFDNVRHMSWFIDEVAGKLIELGMVGTSPNEGMGDDDIFRTYSDDYEDDLEEAFGDVEEDALFKPEEAPAYDDEKEDEDFESECGMSEEGDGQPCSIVSLYDNERVYYALADKFGAEVDFGDSDYQVMVPGSPEEVQGYLAGFGFKPGTDYEVESHVEEDMNNGYYDQQTHDADDFFPTGATSNVTKDRGPAGAKHGDNPMSTRAKVKENRAIYESMRQAYRRHRLK